MRHAFILLVCLAFQLKSQTPEPAPLHLEPTTLEPAPLHHEPTTLEPAPLHHEPTSLEPAPLHHEPAPLHHEPTTLEPAPLHHEPAPSHQPTTSKPAPSHQPTSSEPSPEPQPSPNPDDDATWQWVELGLHIALIVVGLCWLLVGYRLIRFVLFVAGFIVFFFISLQLLVTLTVEKGTLAKWIAYAISGGIGFIGASVFVVLRKVGVFLYGTLLGILFSSVVLSSTPLATLNISPMIQLIVLLCAGVLLGIVSVIFERVLFIIGTSFNGSYLILNSIDSEWVLSGSSNMIVHIFKDFDNPLSFDVGNWKAYLILAAIIILAVIGIVVQFKWTAGEQKSKTSKEDIPLLTTINV